MSIEEEVWKPIIGEQWYQVSNMGRIKRLAGMPRFNGIGTYSLPEGFLKGSRTKFGYIIVKLGNKDRLVHRLVAMAFHHDSEFFGMDVNHKDGNKANNSHLNLEWCTRKHNINHAFDTGLQKNGEKHHAAKYSDVIVNEIRRLYEKENLRPCEIRRLFPDIHRTTVNSFIYSHKRKGRLTEAEKIELKERISVAKLAHREFGSALKGENNPKSVLTELQAKEILSTYKNRPDSMTRKAFADQYGISEPGLKMLLSRRTWKHITA